MRAVPEVAEMNEAHVRPVVDQVVEQWWGTIVATTDCGEPAKQDLKDRFVRCVMSLLRTRRTRRRAVKNTRPS